MGCAARDCLCFYKEIITVITVLVINEDYCSPRLWQKCIRKKMTPYTKIHTY